MQFADCAKLRRENIKPDDLSSECPYIGLEHIGQKSLQLLDIGSSRDVTSTKQKFSNGDILFGKLRPYFRKVARPDFNGVCSTDIWVIQSLEGIDQGFLFYWVASWDFVNFVNSASEGTRMPRAKWEVAQTHEIPDFHLSEQRAIAHILGTLDDKIELNQKMNETLEEIAKAIFKSWFVDFDPVRAKAEGRPTGLPPEISDLFPSELVDSEIGEIPKGWDINPLGNVFLIQYGKNLPTKNLIEEGYPVFGGNGVIGFHSKYIYEEVMTLIACRGAASGKVGRSLPKSFVTNNSLVINHKGAALTSQRFIEFTLESGDPENYVTGSAQPQLTIDNIKNFPFMTPSSEIVDSFQEIVNPLSDRQLLLDSENQVLSELRDTLLPKLISGELRIPDAEKFLKEAGI